MRHIGQLPTGRVLTAGSALLALVLFASGVSSPVRSIAVLWFLVVCPGMAVVQRIALRSPALEFMLVVPVSLAIDETVSLSLMYLRGWTPGRCLAVIAVVTVVVAWWPASGRRRLEPSA